MQSLLERLLASSIETRARIESLRIYIDTETDTVISGICGGIYRYTQKLDTEFQSSIPDYLYSKNPGWHIREMRTEYTKLRDILICMEYLKSCDVSRIQQLFGISKTTVYKVLAKAKIDRHSIRLPRG
jgi:predicted mannosyl-3-phosphoglycerate phosphatase (HAD superfamily)